MKKITLLLTTMVTAPYAMAAVSPSVVSVKEDQIIVTGKQTPNVFVNKGYVKNGKHIFWIDVPSAKSVNIVPSMKKYVKIKPIKTGGYRAIFTLEDDISLTSMKTKGQRVLTLTRKSEHIEMATDVKSNDVSADNIEKAVVKAVEVKEKRVVSNNITDVVFGPNLHDDTDRLIFNTDNSVNISSLKLVKKNDKEYLMELPNNVNLPDILINDRLFQTALTLEKTSAFVANNGKKTVLLKFKTIPAVSIEKTQSGFQLVAKKDYEAEMNASKKNYTGRKISLNFQKIEVRSVLQVIAEFTNLNIIASEKVTGDITLAMKDVPWDQALDVLLQTKGLDMRKNGNVIWIGARDEIAAADAADITTENQRELALPIINEAIQINYQVASEVSAILSNGNQKMLSARGSVVVDPKTNTLFVRDNAERLKDVKALIKRIDIPARQVLISAKITETEVGLGKTIGARLGIGSTGQVGSSKFGISNSMASATTGAITGAFTSVGTNVNLPASTPSTGGAAGTIALSVFNSSMSKMISLELSALESENKSRNISEPQILAFDNIESYISKGIEIPYQEATSSGATSISFRQAALGLKVKPQITPDGSVMIDINLTNGSIGQTTTAGPTINNTVYTGKVRVMDGGTIVIGGIIIDEEIKQAQKVPFFGDLPLLGHLFKTDTKTNSRRELNIILTPVVQK